MDARTDQIEPSLTRPPAANGGRLFFGLSSRVLGLTILFVLLIEALVFLPSAANFRANWIENRIAQARIAVLALDAAPMREVSDELADALLMSAEVLCVVEVKDGVRKQLLAQDMLPKGDALVAEAANLRRFSAIGPTLGATFGSGERWLLILDPAADVDHLEILVPIAPLKADLIAFAWRIVGLSLLIAAGVGALIFLSLYAMVVRPILRITSSVEQFRDNPRDWTLRLPETPRSDEIGRAQNALSDMEAAVQAAFLQRERLARLGEAMAKINHNLRNSLSAAQLVSEGLTRSDDPRVLRAAPRIERALERAISLAEATLDYGRGTPAEARIVDIALLDVCTEATGEGIFGPGDIAVNIAVPAETRVQADADHLHRIVVNLARNAARAMSDAATPAPMFTISGRVEGGRCLIHFADNGPGIPERLRPRLFEPFSASGNKGGSGLGLAIARELAESMGARLELTATGPGGTVFALDLPSAPA